MNDITIAEDDYCWLNNMPKAMNIVKSITDEVKATIKRNGTSEPLIKTFDNTFQVKCIHSGPIGYNRVTLSYKTINETIFRPKGKRAIGYKIAKTL